MAPELMSGKSPRSLAADVWALGMTLLEIITGEIPFPHLRYMTDLKREVVDNAKTPNRPDTILDRSEHGGALWINLLGCWAYRAEARIKAKDILQFFEVIIPSGGFTLDFNHAISADELVLYLTRTWSLRDWTVGLDSTTMPIAGGGFGDVYRGTISNGTLVAMKSPRLSVSRYRVGRGIEVLKSLYRVSHVMS